MGKTIEERGLNIQRKVIMSSLAHRARVPRLIGF
jgi:hypothetical protein